MTGENAYTNYCSAVKDCSAPDIPRYNSVEQYIKYAQKIMHENRTLHDPEQFDKFLPD